MTAPVSSTEGTAWTADQISRFIENGEFEDDESEDVEHGNLDLQYAVDSMPEPGDVNELYKQKDNAGPSAAHDMGDMTGLLANLLDPDAGGKGRNADGIGGLLAASREAQRREQRGGRAEKKKTGKAATRAKLRAKIAMMRKMRGVDGGLPQQTDKNGRKVRGSMAIDPQQFIDAGVPLPRNAQQGDRGGATRSAQRRSLLDKLQERMEQRQNLSL